MKLIKSALPLFYGTVISLVAIVIQFILLEVSSQIIVPIGIKFFNCTLETPCTDAIKLLAISVSLLRLFSTVVIPLLIFSGTILLVLRLHKNLSTGNKILLVIGNYLALWLITYLLSNALYSQLFKSNNPNRFLNYLAPDNTFLNSLNIKNPGSIFEVKTVHGKIRPEVNSVRINLTPNSTKIAEIYDIRAINDLENLQKEEYGEGAVAEDSSQSPIIVQGTEYTFSRHSRKVTMPDANNCKREATLFYEDFVTKEGLWIVIEDRFTVEKCAGEEEKVIFRIEDHAIKGARELISTIDFRPN